MLGYTTPQCKQPGNALVCAQEVFEPAPKSPQHTWALLVPTQEPEHMKPLQSGSPGNSSILQCFQTCKHQ